MRSVVFIFDKSNVERICPLLFSPSGSDSISLRPLDPEAEGTRILQTV